MGTDQEKLARSGLAPGLSPFVVGGKSVLGEMQLGLPELLPPEDERRRPSLRPLQEGPVSVKAALFLVGHEGVIAAPVRRELQAFSQGADPALFLTDLPREGSGPGGPLSPENDGDRIELTRGESLAAEVELGPGQGDPRRKETIQAPQISAEAVGEVLQEGLDLRGKPKARLDGHDSGRIHHARTISGR